MTTKCLLICEKDILVAGVKALLANQAELEIFTINSFTEMELMQTIETLHPNVVIIEDDIRPMPPNQTWNLLMSLPNLQVIIFNQNDNLLRIHQNKWSKNAHIHDLGKVIHKHKSNSPLSDTREINPQSGETQ